MAIANMKVFDQYAYTAVTEVLRQQLALFNSATRGAILLRSGANQGDFSDATFYQLISGLVRRRNAYGSGAVSPVTLNQVVDTSVKVAASTPPFQYDNVQFDWIQRNQEEAGAVYGQQLAVGMAADFLNTGILAVVAALASESEVYNTAGQGAVQNFNNLVTTAGAFGDRMHDIRVWVMHSKSLTDLYKESLANSTRLFEFGNIQVSQDGFGRIFVMTDSPALVVPSPSPQTSPETPVRYRTLGLAPGAILVEQNNDFSSAANVITGKENIGHEMQSEWSFNLGLKGFTYEKGVGSANKSPNDSTIGNSANWTRTVTDKKDLAGVLALTL